MTTLKDDGCVEFRFFRPQAGEVRIAGDFNAWSSQTGLTMDRQGDGWWVAEASLPPGEYRFRYCADGRWFTDYAAYGVESTPHGWNAVLVVPKGKHQPTPP